MKLRRARGPAALLNKAKDGADSGMCAFSYKLMHTVGASSRWNITNYMILQIWEKAKQKPF